jgi:hypothetical protein
LQVGIANLGNSLAAIKKLVFEDRKIDAGELRKYLDNNFEGKDGERIRQLLLNYAPKYGNDDDYVDEAVAGCLFLLYPGTRQSTLPPAITAVRSDAGIMPGHRAYPPMSRQVPLCRLPLTEESLYTAGRRLFTYFRHRQTRSDGGIQIGF